MDILNPDCAAQSVGLANQLFSLLLQTMLAAQCAISPEDAWAEDYESTALEQGGWEEEFVPHSRDCVSY